MFLREESARRRGIKEHETGDGTVAVHDGDYSDQSTVSVPHDDQHRVRFSTVEVREYACMIGDHPNCDPEGGLALSLDWKFNPDTLIYNVEDCDLYSFDFKIRRLSFLERKNRLKVVSGIEVVGDSKKHERSSFACVLDAELPPQEEEQEDERNEDSKIL